MDDFVTMMNSVSNVGLLVHILLGNLNQTKWLGFEPGTMRCTEITPFAEPTGGLSVMLTFRPHYRPRVLGPWNSVDFNVFVLKPLKKNTKHY